VSESVVEVEVEFDWGQNDRDVWIRRAEWRVEGQWRAPSVASSMAETVTEVMNDDA
jgi:hypothetical protein